MTTEKCSGYIVSQLHVEYLARLGAGVAKMIRGLVKLRFMSSL